MKKLLTLYTTLLALCLLLLSCFASCDDDFVEYYNRWDITPCTGGTNTTSNSATLRGYIQCNGVWSGAISTVPVDECYFMLFSFSNGNSTRIDIPAPSLDEEFAAQVTGLTPGYYRYTLCVRYGELIAESSPESFTISLDAPILSDLQYTDLTATSVTLSGSVLDDGGGQLEALELHWRDFYYESENEVELSPDSYSFTYTVSGLVPNTTYYFWMRGSNQYPYDSDYLVLKTPSAS